MIINTVFALNLKPIDIIFLGLFLGLVILLLIFLVIKKITDRKTDKVLKAEFDRLQNDEATNKNVIDAKKETNQESVVVEEKVSTPKDEKKVEPVVVSKNDVAEEVKQEDKVEPVVVENEEEDVETEVVTEEETDEVEPVVTETTPRTALEETKNDTLVEAEIANESNDDVNESVGDGAKVRTYNGKFEVYQENNYYRYRLKASNGEVLFNSEIYASKDTVLKSIGAVKRNIENGKTSIVVDKNKNYKFKLLAANHRVLAISANYSSERGAQSALDSFKRFALTADVVEIDLPSEELDATLVEVLKNKEEDKKGGKFVLRKDKNGEFTWEFKASNGETLCKASGYSNRKSLDTSIASFKENVKNGKFYIYNDKSGNYQFKLYNNGRLSMVGEAYSTNAVATDVVTSILNFIELAAISDRTVAPVKKDTATKTTTAKTTKSATTKAAKTSTTKK